MGVVTSLHPFNGLFSRTTWVSWYQIGKTSLDLNVARDGDSSGISWTICKQSAPHSRQITTPTPHHSIFTSWMLFLTPNQQCSLLCVTVMIGGTLCSVVSSRMTWRRLTLPPTPEPCTFHGLIMPSAPGTLQWLAHVYGTVCRLNCEC